MKTVITAVLCAAALALAVPVRAQKAATLVLKSGERVSGDLFDLGGQGFWIKVNGQDRNIPKNDVAEIDFGGPVALSADDLSKLNAGRPLIRLTSGEMVEGTLNDIGGTTPLRLTVGTPSGQRDFTSDQVANIYLATPPGAAVATTGQLPTPAAPGAGAIQVPGNQPWTDTGMTVKKGDRVAFMTTGQVQIAPGAIAGPDGYGSDTGNRATYPVQVQPAGALIGRVGTGQAFPIGANNQGITMPADGRLYLGINDSNFSDNGGAFNVQIARQQSR